MEADADLEKVLVIDDRDTPLTLADERIARAIRENSARLVIIDPVQAFLGADVDMNRANEVRPIFRSLGDIAQATFKERIGKHYEKNGIMRCVHALVRLFGWMQYDTTEQPGTR